jgi:hypothetical protein
MFGLVFPAKSVTTGQKWQKTLNMKKMGQITLDGKGVQMPVTFTRLSDSLTTGNILNAFNVSSSFKRRNLSGTMIQSGMTLNVKIPQMDRENSGLMIFDRMRGVLIHAEDNNTISARMSLSLGEDSAILTMKATNVSKIDLIK